MAFYAERLPIPTQTEHGITPEGTLGPEMRDLRVCREGILRELQVDVIVDLTTAENLVGWLQTHLDRARKQQQDETVGAGDQKPSDAQEETARHD